MILVVMVVFKNTVSRAFLNFRWEGDRKFPQWLDRRMRTCYGRTKKRRRGEKTKVRTQKKTSLMRISLVSLSVPLRLGIAW